MPKPELDTACLFQRMLGIELHVAIVILSASVVTIVAMSLKAGCICIYFGRGLWGIPLSSVMVIAFCQL